MVYEEHSFECGEETCLRCGCAPHAAGTSRRNHQGVGAEEGSAMRAASPPPSRERLSPKTTACCPDAVWRVPPPALHAWASRAAPRSGPPRCDCAHGASEGCKSHSA